MTQALLPVTDRLRRMSLSIYLKGDYEELYALKAAKNKANSKPIRLFYRRERRVRGGF
jgi:hypothetical protein